MTDLPDLATWTDEQIKEAWMASSWEHGDPEADELAVEMERQEIDF